MPDVHRFPLRYRRCDFTHGRHLSSQILSIGQSALAEPLLALGLLGPLAALLAERRIPHYWQGSKLLFTAWHGKTHFTALVWLNGSRNNAACSGEHGNWFDLLAVPSRYLQQILDRRQIITLTDATLVQKKRR